MQYSFGAGVLFGRKTGAGVVATPVRFGALQNVNVDITATTKTLFGSNQYPLAIGRGVANINCKAQFGQFNAQALNDLFFGEETGVTTGQRVTAVGEAKTVTANVVNVTNNTTFFADLGVILASTGDVYTRVTAAPVGLQYTCNESTGNYGFNSSQNGVAVKVSYEYTDAANGKTLTINNQLLGVAPTFMVVLTNTFQGKRFNLQLNQCVSNKLTIPTSLEDFWMPEFDFQAMSDSADIVGTLSLAE